MQIYSAAGKKKVKFWIPQLGYLFPIITCNVMVQDPKLACCSETQDRIGEKNYVEYNFDGSGSSGSSAELYL